MRVALALVLIALAADAGAQPAAPPPAAASAAASGAPAAKAAPAASAAAEAAPQPPPGPPEGAMPPGHPNVPGMPGQAGMGAQGPQDTVQQVPAIDVGSIEVTIADSERKPVANVPVTLAIKFETVDEGEREFTQEGRSDAQGRVIFKGQKTGSDYQYRAIANREGASFPSRPFRLTQQGGVRVVLHTSAPVTKLEEVPLVVDAVLMMEIKEDSIACTHLLRTVNLGKNAFITPGIVMPLPADAMAFKEESSTDGIQVVQREGALLLKGTFPPGQAQATYRYQVPVSGNTQRLRVALPPRVITSRVMIGAGAAMTLEVAGYAPAVVNRVGDGKRVLETVKRVDIRGGMDGLLKHTDPEFLDIRIGGIPAPGPGRMIALLLAGLAVAAGAYHTYRTHERAESMPEEQRRDLLEARDALLDEIAALERAHRSGEVGPQSYERLRNALLDAVARIVTQLDGKAPAQLATAVGTQAKAHAAKDTPAKGKGKGKAKRKGKAKGARARS